ncbi:hypothetical protein EUX98_g5719 [Antrodiella citrinella]|uniref:Protein kinase domain-containing protein n=1 Tax=Antrodiella citrinella TaxID=2447956 RepID=A0A4S4MQR4_9APHY|nr:hypothetical protein EUX98_g5719 [Antrodiella citrinella]
MSVYCRRSTHLSISRRAFTDILQMQPLQPPGALPSAPQMHRGYSLPAKDINEIHSLIDRALKSKDERWRLLDLPIAEAQVALDEIWEDLGSAGEGPNTYSYRNALLRLAFKVAYHFDFLPSALFLTDVVRTETENRGAGGFADVFYGTYQKRADEIVTVAIKRVRIYDVTQEDQRTKRKRAFFRESMLWRHLFHRHILPCLGVSQELFNKSAMCIILPWKAKGSIRHYLTEIKKYGDLPGKVLADTINEWLFQISVGLAYLHEEGIIHGDLHGGNVLVNDDATICLTDFGMALIAEASGYNYASAHGGGAVYWQAPEVIDHEAFGLPSSRPTFASDVYSFACTCIELYTGLAPFSDLTLVQYSRRILNGLRPPRPQLYDGTAVPDAIWEVIKACWTNRAEARPHSDQVARTLNRATLMASQSLGRYRLPATDLVSRLHAAFTRRRDTVVRSNGRAYIHYDQFQATILDFLDNLKSDIAGILDTEELVLWLSTMPLVYRAPAQRVDPPSLLRWITVIPCFLPPHGTELPAQFWPKFYHIESFDSTSGVLTSGDTRRDDPISRIPSARELEKIPASNESSDSESDDADNGDSDGGDSNIANRSDSGDSDSDGELGTSSHPPLANATAGLNSSTHPQTAQPDRSSFVGGIRSELRPSHDPARLERSYEIAPQVRRSTKPLNPAPGRTDYQQFPTAQQYPTPLPLLPDRKRSAPPSTSQPPSNLNAETDPRGRKDQASKQHDRFTPPVVEVDEPGSIVQEPIRSQGPSWTRWRPVPPEEPPSSRVTPPNDPSGIPHRSRPQDVPDRQQRPSASAQRLKPLETSPALMQSKSSTGARGLRGQELDVDTSPNLKPIPRWYMPPAPSSSKLRPRTTADVAESNRKLPVPPPQAEQLSANEEIFQDLIALRREQSLVVHSSLSMTIR